MAQNDALNDKQRAHLNNALSLARMLREAALTELASAKAEHRDAMLKTQVLAAEMQHATVLWARGNVSSDAQTACALAWRNAVAAEEQARLRTNAMQERADAALAEVIALDERL